ncbi:hypothetical protein [Streptococcus oralis]|nr:hypothetical protein [Streptococcus oralis]
MTDIHGNLLWDGNYKA